MTDYIDREVAINKAEKYGLSDGSVIGRHSGIADCIASEISKIPAADVAPVRRGHWVRIGNGTTCSECMQGLLRINWKQSEWVDLSGMPYCPNCGAKMEVPNDD